MCDTDFSSEVNTMIYLRALILVASGMLSAMCSSDENTGDTDTGTTSNVDADADGDSDGDADGDADDDSDTGSAGNGDADSDTDGDTDGDGDSDSDSDSDTGSAGDRDTDGGGDDDTDSDSDSDADLDSDTDADSDSYSDGDADSEVGEVTCDQAAGPYTIESEPLGPDVIAVQGASGWGANLAPFLSVAVNPEDNQVYVGLTQDLDGTPTATIAGRSGIVAETPDAVNAGIAVTADGFGQLLFDPNPAIDDRMWAAVVRFGTDGSPLFNTDLFRSPNLDDEGTKGAPNTARLGYIPGTDELVAYFAHTQRYDDDVRHQGGYLALVDSSGEQNLLDGWFGSHNLDQRLLVEHDDAAVLGLGDAYPEGIFFSFTSQGPRTNVIYQLASAGNGTTNGQLGGMVDLGDEIVIPFITNNSIAQDIDAGTWPDIDETVSDQIRAAADNGTDMGLLRVAKDASPDSELPAAWVTPKLTDGTSFVQLKSAPYGDGGLILLLWAERSGSDWRSEVTGYFSMVVDQDGAVCQPRTPFDSQYAFTEGDDIITTPNGTIVWANADTNGEVNIITLTPQ